MKRNASKFHGSIHSKNKKAIVLMVCGFLTAIIGFSVIISKMVKEENDVKNYDAVGFHLGNMLSSITNIVTVSDDVSDEEKEEYENLVEKLYTAEEIQIEDYIACLQYVKGLELNDERNLIQRTIDLVQNGSDERAITKDAFWGGYAVGAIMPAISIYNKEGIVSDRVFKDMFKRYLDLMERPTEKKVYEYAKKGEEILISLGF